MKNRYKRHSKTAATLCYRFIQWKLYYKNNKATYAITYMKENILTCSSSFSKEIRTDIWNLGILQKHIQTAL